MSTGLQSIDYFVADRHLVPPEHEDLFTETLLFLPAATTFDPHPDAPEVSALPAMQSGTFTFACLARANKLNRTLIRTWVSILRAVPNSRLLLAAMPDGSAPQAVLQWFAAQGFTPADLRTRLAFAHIRNVEELLALHSQIDLALDTFPYTGSTSSSHALWMGVPTLTIAGDTTVGRMGAALALHVGLPEFIASDPEAYVRRAIGFARAPSSLAELRPQLRARFSASALQQHEHHATAVAEELRAVWRRWCASQPASW